MINRDDLIHFLDMQLHGKNASVIKHILVADDNQANRLIAKTILERDGYKISLAENGLEALRAVEAQASQNQVFDIILMDILMPVMDGIKSLRRIKALSPGIKVPPIFAITAFCNPADQRRYSMAGFDAILTKPLKHGDVELALKQLSFGMAKTPVKPPVNNTRNFNSVAILDDVIINQLRMAANAPALKNIQQKFWTEVQSNSQTIKTALPAALKTMPKGLTEMRKSVHAIKGASASIGLLRTAHIARHLQNAPPSDIRGLLQDLFETLIISKPLLNTALLEQTATLSCEAVRRSGANARTR